MGTIKLKTISLNLYFHHQQQKKKFHLKHNKMIFRKILERRKIKLSPHKNLKTTKSSMIYWMI